MERDFSRLEGQTFDVLVIGGGIYGAWVAYDAALRGLRVALIEKEDWGAGTSSASSKLIHGGLRYLEQHRLGLVRRSLEERSLLSRLAPHRVHPMRFLLPVYRGDRVGRTRLGLGLWLYDLLAGSSSPVGRRQALGKRALLDAFELEPDQLRGGFLFGDCQTDDARLTLEIVHGAIEAGAVALNRAQALDLLMEGTDARGASVEDRETGGVVPVRATVTVACAGAWNHGLLKAVMRPSKPRPRLTKGVHLVMPPLPADEGLLVTSREDERVIFLIPWYDRTLLGTTDTDYDGDPDRVAVEPADVAYLLNGANRVLRGAPWKEADVISSFAGLRTLPASKHHSPSSVTREWQLEQPLKNVLAHVGGKLTSARADAAIAVDRVVALVGRQAHPCLTSTRRFPWSPGGDYDEWSRRALSIGLALGVDEETIESCLRRFGSNVDQLFDLIQETPELAGRIVPEAPFCLAEIVHAVNREMARTLEDVLRRRIPLLLVARLDEPALNRIAALVGELLGWSDQHRREEVAAVRGGAGALNVHEHA